MSIAAGDGRIQSMVRTRFAPSPTGSLHIGGLRTAVYAFVLAKHNKGKFILRIEDTDKKREVAGGTEQIQQTLKDFGITWDEYYVQSERVKTGIYQKAAEKLVKDGHAYYDEKAIRLKIPKSETVSYRDFVLKKDISWNTDSLEDLVLLKSDGFPTYHLASVVDDHDMTITHVLRGHDWLPSTPIHLLIYKYLNFDKPEIGHLTDIQDPSGGKLSKRKGNVSCEEFLAEGYLPEALINFVILMGWAPKDNRELFTLNEFVKFFDPNGFQKSNPVFHTEKLDWFNGHYIRQKSDAELVTLLSKFAPDADKSLLTKITPLIKDRIKKLSDILSFAGFFFTPPKVDKSLLGENHPSHLSSALESISNLDSWNLDALNKSLLKVVDKQGFKTGDFFMDLRVAITGARFTPPINDSIIILGKEEAIARLKNILDN